MGQALTDTDTFTIDSLPDLHTVVLAALERFMEIPVQRLPSLSERPLLIGSGNALATAAIIGRDTASYLADEGSFVHTLTRYKDITEVVIVSASGGKHAVTIAKELKGSDLPLTVLTTNPEPPVAKVAPEASYVTFPRNREPYTYNTSTYLGMILASTGESPESIHRFLTTEIDGRLQKQFDSYTAFLFIVPSEFAAVTSMIRTKFDELFGPMVTGRVFTDEEIKHAKTVVESPEELVISLGVGDQPYGHDNHRLSLPLQDGANFAEVLAVAYYTVGKIQAAHLPYFKQSIVRYTQTASDIFGQQIDPIVE